MPVIALTDANLAFVKSSFRAELKDVKSSHLTEAIAAGFGYQTHAALLADQASISPPAKAVQANEFLFRQRLAAFSQTPVPPPLFSEVLWSPNIPDPVWRIFAKDDIGGLNHWYRACQRRNMPYVYIESRRTLTSLDWDCISLEPPCDEAIRRDETNIVRIMFRGFQAIASRKRARFMGSAFVGQVEALSIDEARRLADGIALILDRAIVRKPFPSPTL